MLYVCATSALLHYEGAPLHTSHASNVAVAYSLDCHCCLLAGTSSVLACALLQPLMAGLGMPLQQRQQLVKGLLGTHAHEMTSITQQLLAGYDQEAGRRCGLKVRT